MSNFLFGGEQIQTPQIGYTSGFNMFPAFMRRYLRQALRTMPVSQPVMYGGSQYNVPSNAGLRIMQMLMSMAKPLQTTQPVSVRQGGLFPAIGGLLAALGGNQGFKWFR